MGGRVQGVWLRASTLRQAKLLGLCGHAINCTDGSVKVLACGEAESIKVLAEWLQNGPPMAEVKTVSRVPFAGIAPDRFTTG